MIDTITSDLKRDEGFVSHAYQDSRGYWTIGCGRLIDKHLGGGISETEAGYLLENDIASVISDLDRALPWWDSMPEPWQRGLLNMTFNLGLTRLLTFEKMLAALKTRDGDRAATEALDSKWAGQVGARATRIAALYRGIA